MERGLGGTRSCFRPLLGMWAIYLGGELVCPLLASQCYRKFKVAPSRDVGGDGLPGGLMSLG